MLFLGLKDRVSDEPQNLIWFDGCCKVDPPELMMLSYPRVLLTLGATDLLGNWLISRHSFPSGGGGEKHSYDLWMKNVY